MADDNATVTVTVDWASILDAQSTLDAAKEGWAAIDGVGSNDALANAHVQRASDAPNVPRKEAMTTTSLTELMTSEWVRGLYDGYAKDIARHGYILSPQQAIDYQRAPNDDLTPEQRVHNQRCRDADRAFNTALTRVRDRLSIDLDDYEDEDEDDVAYCMLREVGYRKLTPDNAQQVEDLCVEFVERLRAIGEAK